VLVLWQAHEKGPVLKYVVEDKRARNLLDITYRTMMQKIQMVDNAVAASEGRFSAEDIIEKRLQDRLPRTNMQGVDVVILCPWRTSTMQCVIAQRMNVL
jgi:hypothetical protein